MTRFSVMASGRGSNFDAILAAVKDGRLKAQIASVICDREGAPVIAKAEAVGLKVRLVQVDPKLKGQARREEHEQRILAALREDGAEWLVLAGYMRVLTPLLIQAFRDDERGITKMVNVHPSLLPAFDGLDSYRRAFEHGCHVAGVTVHLVEEDVDSGPICVQEAFEIASLESAEDVEQVGLKIEHRVFPATLGWLFEGNFSVESTGQGRRRVVRGANRSVGGVRTCFLESK